MRPRFKSQHWRHVIMICGLCLLSVISLALRGFSPGSPVFLSPQKPTFPNSNSSRNQVDEKQLAGCATSKSLLLLFIIYLNSSAKLWNFTSAYKIFALFGHIILSYLMIFTVLSIVVSMIIMIWYSLTALLSKVKKNLERSITYCYKIPKVQL